MLKMTLSLLSSKCLTIPMIVVYSNDSTPVGPVWTLGVHLAPDEKMVYSAITKGYHSNPKDPHIELT